MASSDWSVSHIVVRMVTSLKAASPHIFSKILKLFNEELDIRVSVILWMYISPLMQKF
jgi:hypothetical protein